MLAGQVVLLAALLVWRVGMPTMLRASTTVIGAAPALPLSIVRLATTAGTLSAAPFTASVASRSKDADLHLLISITSGPAHTLLRQAARETWLSPCAQSPLCDYRFFVDRPETNVTDALATENRCDSSTAAGTFSWLSTFSRTSPPSTHRDMVFRGHWCPFMEGRHHHAINYGASNRTTEAIATTVVGRLNRHC